MKNRRRNQRDDCPICEGTLVEIQRGPRNTAHARPCPFCFPDHMADAHGYKWPTTNAAHQKCLDRQKAA